ncbi:MAG: hypothetical protein J1E31_01205 [Helicobacter sp.]|nr:hypothetical protein [Helicobacter sp.]
MRNEEIKVDFNNEPPRGFLRRLFVVILAIIASFGIFLYIVDQPYGEKLISYAQEILGIPNTNPAKMPLAINPNEDNAVVLAKDEEILRLQQALAQKENELTALSASVNGLSSSVEQMKKDRQTITNNMRFSIKPKKQIVTECYSMVRGEWKIPQACLLSIATKVNAELANDKRVVAFEVSGIVDSVPYGGLSPELKQEGLASFRAWEAIREINRKIPTATAFEGASIQSPDKRGYSIKAYFVE